MELRGGSGQTRRQMEAFADTYFGQFRKTPFGMMRLDPQDSGPAYRNVIGIPKGTESPLFEVLKVRVYFGKSWCRMVMQSPAGLCSFTDLPMPC